MSANREVVPSGAEWDAEQLRNLTDAELHAETVARMERFEERDGREPGYIPLADYYADDALARAFRESHRRDEGRDE